MFVTRARSHVGRELPKATAGAGGRRATWWSRIFFRTGAACAALLAGIGAQASPLAVESGNYRSATAAPKTWQAFARQLQGRVEQRLAGDDERARHFQDYLTRRSEQADARLTVVLRTWVLTDGTVDRVEFDGIDDPHAIDDLRAVLIDGNVGAPPPEMLQPLHLRLSLRAKGQSRQGQ
jgi:hypothetical protein